MKISAIIAEYNPFHHGHAYHLDMTRKKTGADAVICLMSGNFVQRGEPALYDKWARTRMALEMGADLVLELPVAYATGSAQRFAEGAIAILDALGVVDFLSFGCETTDLSVLTHTARLLADEPAGFRTALYEGLTQGLSYPAALAQAAGEETYLSTPNAILAVAYLRALYLRHSRIQPVPILRRGPAHDAPSASSTREASALAVRRAFQAGDPHASEHIPPAARIHAGSPIFAEDVYPLLLYALRMADPKDLSTLAGMSEGLENRLLAACDAPDYASFLKLAGAKRYPLSRIKRLTIMALLGIHDAHIRQIDSEPLYARVLGAKKESGLLSLLSRQSSIPIVTSVAAFQRNTRSTGIALDIRASDIYALLGEGPRPKGRDYTQKLLLI